MASFKLESIPSPKPPKYCTKYFVEFSGKQQKLSAFFTQNSSSQTTQFSTTTTQISTTTLNDIGEKRKLVDTTGNGQAMKRPKNGQQQQQRNLLSFFKPQNPPKVEAVTVQQNAVSVVSNDENPLKVEELDPEKRVQVIIHNIALTEK